MATSVQSLYQQGQSIWCDNLGRRMIEDGELDRLIDIGVVGVTSNPTIFMKAITGSADYDRSFDRLLAEGRDTAGIYEGLVMADVADAADRLRPIHDRTGGVDGFVSLEVNPQLADDTEGTIAEARRFFAALDRPNVMIKVPATPAGMPAVETLIAEGVNVNITLIFSLTLYEQVMRAYLGGLRRFQDAGGDLGKVASVASFFVSRVDTLVDKQLDEKRKSGANVDHLLGRAAIANAKLAYARFREVFGEHGEFAALLAKGAHVQRPLWASTSTKNPAYSPTKYVDGLVLPQTVNTLPPPTIDVLERGSASPQLADVGLGADESLFDELRAVGVDIDEVTQQLLADGVGSFARSFDELIENLRRKREQLRAAG